MGQYYLPVNLDKCQYMDPYDYGNGAKLMEHSWIGNNFVETIARSLLPGRPWHQSRIVWAGDYMDEGVFLEEYPEADKATTLYDFASCRKNTPFENIRPGIPDGPIARYLVNHSQKEFVDLSKVVTTEDNWKIHPMPLLTSSGNGRGGGDFRGENSYVGAWAGQQISMQYSTPKGMKEISPDFRE